MYDVNNPKRAAAQSPEQRHARHRPKDEFQVPILTNMRTVIRFADRHRQDRVRHHPRHNHVCTYGAVVIFLLLRLADPRLRDLEAVTEIAERFVVAGIDIQLLTWHFKFYSVAFAGDGSAEIDVDDVVALCAPGDVVGVAEGIDLESADVGGEKCKVLR